MNLNVYCLFNVRGGTPGSLGSLINDRQGFTCIPIRIPLQYNEANLYALYGRFLVALSTQQRTLASNLFVIST